MSRLLGRLMAPVRTPRRRASPKAPLLLRALEERIAPAAFTVTNTGDTGTGSGTSGDLRYCINQSNLTAGPNTIDASGVGGTITLTSALPTIASGHDLNITGPGAGLLTVSGANSFHIFVDNTSNFAVSGLVLSGGRSPDSGGAIQMSAANEVLTVTNCAISACSAGNYGGGIYNYSGGSVTVAGSTIGACSAGNGGAIFSYSSGSITVNNCTIQGNSASYGGGIDLYSGGQLSVSNSTITGNTAQNTGGGINLYFGGQLSVSNCLITANQAGTNGGGLKVGRGSVTVTQSTVSGNSAAHNGGGMSVGYGFGSGGANLLIDRSTLSGNTAGGITVGGGGLYFAGAVGASGASIVNSTIANNTAINGGGIAASLLQGTITVTSTTISGNSATSTNTAQSGRGGGGIALYSASTTSGAYSAIVLDNTIVSGNNATNGNQDIAERTPGATVHINAVFSALGTTSGYSLNNLGGNLSPANSTPNALQLGALSDNGGPTQTVPIGAGSMALDAGDQVLAGTTDQRGIQRPQGPKIDIGAFERVSGIPSATANTHGVLSAAEPAIYQFTVTYSDGSAMEYSSINGNNNAVTVTGVLSEGRGTVTPTVTFVSATPSANAPSVTATYQFTAPGGAWSTADNGMYTVNVAANQVKNIGSAFIPAGAVGSFQVAVPRTITVTNRNDGGAGSLRQAIFDAQADTTVADNIVFAPGLTGTIVLTTGVLTIACSLTIAGPADNGIVVSGNNASQVFSISGTGRAVLLKNLEITGGNATTSGGAVFMGNNTVTFDTDWIHGNQTTATGGGIGSTAGATITVKNSAITGNSAVGAGGAIYGTSVGAPTTISVQDSTLTGNSAGGVGGGIGTISPPPFETSPYASGSVSVHNATITGNTATGGGGIGESGIVSVPAFLISSIVSGNNGPSASPDFLVPTVNASHSAIGSTSGITTYNNLGGNLFGSMGLLPLAFNGGSTPSHALPPSSPAIDAGSNPDGEQYDQRGVGYSREAPAGLPDIGAVERQPGVPTAGAAAPNVTAVNPPPTYQFNVTYTDDSALLYSSVNGNSNAVTVTPPAGVPPVAVTFVSATPLNDAPTITATYEFTFPSGLTAGTDDGTWTVNMGANQVQNINSVFVPAGRLVRFQVQVPRTITVTNTNFSGPGSFLDSITQANADAPSADTIVFSTSTAGGATDFTAGPHTITLLGSLPIIADQVTIIGPGSALLTINANGTGRVLTTGPGAGNAVTISGLTLTGGSVVGNGAGIEATSGNLVLSGMTVQGNIANSSDTGFGGGSGGGLYYAGNVTVTNSVVSGNSARYGGGLCTALSDTTSVITITNSSISNNTAFGFGGGIDIEERGPTLIITGSTLANNRAGSFGGAIDDYYYGSVTISGSTLVGNSAGYLGGGLYYQGGFATTVTVTNSTIANNIAGGGSTESSGGGIAIGVYGNCTLNITSSTITGNTAQAVTTTNRNNYAYGGGGIDVKAGIGVAVHLDNTIVSGNHAVNGRQDIAVVGFTTVTTTYSAIGNTTGFAYTAGTGDLPVGAALNLKPLADNGGPTQTIALGVGSSAIDRGDPAQAGTADQRGVGRPQGSGVDIGAYEWIPNPDAVASAANVTAAGGTTYTFTVAYSDNVPINTATLGSGNVTVTTPAGVPPVTVTYVGANTANPNRVVATYQFTVPGGAWSRADNGAYTINMQPNQVSDAHGSVPTGPIGSFQVLVPRTLTVTNTGDAGIGSGASGDLRYCINQVDLDGAAADTIQFSNGTTGGATNFFDGAARTITLLSSLPAVTGAATIAGPSAAALTINANHAGRVLLTDAGAGNTVTISGLTLTGGTTAANGGGVDVASGNLVVANAVIANNSAAAGAGLYSSSSGAITVSNSTITGNTTPGAGGGIDLASYVAALLTITGTTISNNSARSNGGGVYLAPGDELTLQQSTVAGNTALRGGGLFWYDGGAMLINQSTVSGNVARGGYNGFSGYGGGLYFSGTPFTISPNASEPLTGLTVQNSTLANNTGNCGGGIALRNYPTPSSLNIVGSTITGNTAVSNNMYAASGGGGIAVVSSYGMTINLDNSIVSGNSAGRGGKDVTTSSNSAVTTTYSAIGSTTGFIYTPGPGDLPVGVNLNLQPPANNGGPTQTVALGPGSAAIDHGDPNTGLTTDQRGYARVFGPAPDIGAFEAQPFKVAAVAVNDGSAQRSEVQSITVTFSGPVTFTGGNANAAAAFQLTHAQSGNMVILSAAVTTDSQGRTAVTFGFSGGDIDPVSALNGGVPSLADGRYQLVVLGSAVTGPDGLSLDGDGNGTPGGNYTSPADTLGGGAGQLHLYRIFGDTNGDGVVDQQDLGQFRSAFNAGIGNSLYIAFLDASNSGAVDQVSLGQFRTRFNANVF